MLYHSSNDLAFLQLTRRSGNSLLAAAVGPCPNSKGMETIKLSIQSNGLKFLNKDLCSSRVRTFRASPKKISPFLVLKTARKRNSVDYKQSPRSWACLRNVLRASRIASSGNHPSRTRTILVMLTFRDKNGRIGILETNVTPSNTAKLVKTQKTSKTNILYVWQQQ